MVNMSVWFYVSKALERAYTLIEKCTSFGCGILGNEQFVRPAASTKSFITHHTAHAQLPLARGKIATPYLNDREDIKIDLAPSFSSFHAALKGPALQRSNLLEQLVKVSVACLTQNYD
jgi:hypothetical protein